MPGGGSRKDFLYCRHPRAFFPAGYGFRVPSRTFAGDQASILSCVDLKEKRIGHRHWRRGCFCKLQNVRLPCDYCKRADTKLHEACLHGRDAGRIEISVSGNDRETTLFVKDDGVGFKENKMRKEGLGLNIVRSLANENLDAAFFIDADDCGTQASICIPNRILKN